MIKKCLDTIELEISSYQRVLNSVIANDFLQELYLFREHVGNLIQEAKEIKLVPNALQEKPAKRLSKNKISYKWQNAPNTELPELYHLLIANKLIQKDTTLDQLKAVFSEELLGSFEPIKWHEDNATELLYFILQLEDTNNILKGKQTNYQRLKRCFVKPDGTQFDVVFKSLKNPHWYRVIRAKAAGNHKPYTELSITFTSLPLPLPEPKVRVYCFLAFLCLYSYNKQRKGLSISLTF